jgi:hypothetical protein
MKIVIQIQDLESRGDRWKYAGGNTYVIRNLSQDDIDNYDSIYFKEYLENHFNSSYTGLLPTEEFEMQSYIKSIKVVEDNIEECDPWVVPYTLEVRDVISDGSLKKELFCHRFSPREYYWSDDMKYNDIIGYVEQYYITPTNHLKEYTKKYVNKVTDYLVVNDFIHRDFSRKPYNPQEAS